MRKCSQKRNLSIISMMLLCVILIAGCEANPQESTYQRQWQAGQIVDRADDYSEDEYSTIIFADQPSIEDEIDRFGITLQIEAPSPMPAESRSICREQISGFSHAWMQYGYTYSEENAFDRVSDYVTDELFQAFSQSKLGEKRFREAKLWNVISDIRAIYFYDRFCKFYTTEDGNRIIRVKAEIIARVSGDDDYFIENQNMNKGDVCYECYFYFTDIEPMRIFGIYEITSANRGIYWYTNQGIKRDDSSLIGDEFSLISGGYRYIKGDISLPTSEKNKVHQRVSDFISAFFNVGQGNPDILINGQVDESVMNIYSKLRDAILNSEIVYDQNYVSYSLEMAFPDISLYENDGKTFYVVKESLMLHALDDTVLTYGLDYIETGLWKYSLYLVFQSDDNDFHIIRMEIQPESGPYESAGDLDEG